MPATLNYQVSQSDPNFPWTVLIHGLFGDADNLANLRRHLRDSHNIISIDLPDHGHSPWLEQFSLSHAVTGVKQVLDESEVETASLVGHSLGGKVAMLFALKHSERVDKLIAADIAPASYARSHDGVFAGLNSVNLSQITGRKDADTAMAEHINEPGVRQFLLKGLYRNDQGEWQWRFNIAGLQQNYEAIIGWPEDMDATFDGDVLFVKGGKSDYLTREHRPQIARYFPNARARIIEGTGHWLHAEKPQAFNAIVEKHLNP
ncbi:alpha/beta fold hydrolase [Alteromonas halophila]|uniref:Acyl-CoA esterase n=1 Tax=Alteromonas halophila TaxID=516698 RepID=A0A918JSS3_9ALTE|nr:alpha/beta fold hydrolase [Alteromonas halophila]GGW95490.1 acyl-CoA esterase [Alteromonas halophila]